MTAAVIDLPQRSRVLIICTANICRSPVAELLWRDAARRRGRLVSVASAGLEAQPGRAADPMCVQLMDELGLDLREHRAQRFRADLAVDAELILVMELTHARRIQATAPELAGRVQLLGRWDVGPITDPYRAPRARYERCMTKIRHSIDTWLDRLK